MVHHIELQSIDDILAFLKATAAPGAFNIFRGTTQHAHGLKTSVERKMTADAYQKLGTAPLEHFTLRAFHRAKHLYPESEVLPDADFVETLAAIQHYGGPTRLLDFTYSAAVALYFATNNQDPTDSPTIWAVNLRRLNERLRGIARDREPEHKDWKSRVYQRATPFLPLPARNPFKKQVPGIDDFFYTQVRLSFQLTGEYPALDAVIHIDPARANRRLLMQSGCFLMPLNSKRTFAQNLGGMFGEDLEQQIAQFNPAAIPCTAENILVSLDAAVVTVLRIPPRMRRDPGSAECSECSNCLSVS